MFSKDFLRGASTSAHQIEGSALADGRSFDPHRFSHAPGRVAIAGTGDVAGDCAGKISPTATQPVSTGRFRWSRRAA